jgi:hypothetical protein
MAMPTVTSMSATPGYDEPGQVLISPFAAARCMVSRFLWSHAFRWRAVAGLVDHCVKIRAPHHELAEVVCRRAVAPHSAFSRNVSTRAVSRSAASGS